jgi:glycosyltransferase involved in cell wall biosynthesis
MDIFYFAHLRWDFVYQRPQHLCKRLAQHFRVYYVEEPIHDTAQSFLQQSMSKEGVNILVPHLPHGLNEEDTSVALEGLLRDFMLENENSDYLFWYITPMALSFTERFEPALIIYDCMDELSAFKNAPLALRQQEKALFNKADVVFTGGHHLYEAKKDQHPFIHPFPSSIDRSHFEKARAIDIEPEDQLNIPSPKIGFFGVIDERMDIDLVRDVAALKPDWQLIIIGPVVKIDPASLPQAANIHYLGSKSYDELPAYLSGWDVAMMPFAINESTKFISPTKTPEYLAGGKPVVSTSIRDVVKPYGESGLVQIASTAEEFVAAIETQLDRIDHKQWLKAVDAFLQGNSWDTTVEKMIYLINTKLESKPYNEQTKKESEHV